MDTSRNPKKKGLPTLEKSAKHINLQHTETERGNLNEFKTCEKMLSVIHSKRKKNGL